MGSASCFKWLSGKHVEKEPEDGHGGPVTQQGARPRHGLGRTAGVGGLRDRKDDVAFLSNARTEFAALSECRDTLPSRCVDGRPASLPLHGTAAWLQSSPTALGWTAIRVSAPPERTRINRFAQVSWKL